MMSMQPWDYHEDLSLDRLQLIAKVLADTRRDTIMQHDPTAGDTGWSLGCRIYARSAEMLTRAGETMWPWFKVINPPLEFIFSLGNVPLRFFHGDANHPGGHHLKVTEIEARQANFAFGDGGIDLIWRIAVETNAAGETERVALIGSTPSGNIECCYVIPALNESVTFIEPLTPQSGRGITLPPAAVTPRRDQHAQDEDEGKDI